MNEASCPGKHEPIPEKIIPQLRWYLLHTAEIAIYATQAIQIGYDKHLIASMITRIKEEIDQLEPWYRKEIGE